ncbi:TolC family outer membrane protein [Kaistia dalseonensis]|uniref:Outer membrane protein n=1 Tax=Kaistia dalseonensis TaxID=410840 RepID=A0ABU0H274_9HYPH|nr:TolC family outer membrane protein [Kaistia dalseonensis]MCX5493836.1 TolC family outer membrane protein [Kaistia dalseonensis]MDQ0436401.1 outer membrane protein [Kaistia dalseonensis]
MLFSRVYFASVAVVAVLATAPFASADTLATALAQTYNNNPTLNAMRAQLRAIDEGVPQALSGYRPVLTGTANAGLSTTRTSFGTTGLSPRTVALTIEQPIFRGFQTQNNVKQAESSVLAGRETLRSTEQDVLLDAVSAYTNVLQTQAILALREQNIVFLKEQVRAAQDRLKVGEGTRTDLAQTEASLSAGQTDYDVAVANLNTANATYLQVIGIKPRSLTSPSFSDKALPKSVDAAIQVGLKNHPAILAASYNVDTAAFNVKSIEGQLLPTVSLQGQVAHADDSSSSMPWANSATITANMTVPIYEGGVVYSQARQAKETLGQRRIQLDSARDQVRSAVDSSWGNLEAARAAIVSAQSQIKAAQLALEGVIEEQKVGQRTTLDVLNQQQSLIQARETLVIAQRAQIVAAYTVLSSMGALSAQKLSLKVQEYQPTQHYNAVRDKWIGLRTPDGR